MPRMPRAESRTKIYHIMLRGIERSDIFIDNRDRQYFLELLHKKKKEYGFLLIAYCLMDNHIHLVVQEADADISKIMQSINVSYALYYNKKYDRIGYVFQNRFKSECVEDDRYLMTVIRYVHRNPLAAGMVSDLESYPWSSYREYLSDYMTDSLADNGFFLEILKESGITTQKGFVDYTYEQDNSDDVDRLLKAEQIKNPTERYNNIQSAKIYIKEFLALENTGEYEDDFIYNIRSNVHVHQVVLKLKNYYGLSTREISELIGISKSTVSRWVN